MYTRECHARARKLDGRMGLHAAELMGHSTRAMGTRRKSNVVRSCVIAAGFYGQVDSFVLWAGKFLKVHVTDKQSLILLKKV